MKWNDCKSTPGAQGTTWPLTEKRNKGTDYWLQREDRCLRYTNSQKEELQKPTQMKIWAQQRFYFLRTIRSWNLSEKHLMSSYRRESRHVGIRRFGNSCSWEKKLRKSQKASEKVCQVLPKQPHRPPNKCLTFDPQEGDTDPSSHWTLPYRHNVTENHYFNFPLLKLLDQRVHLVFPTSLLCFVSVLFHK